MWLKHIELKVFDKNIIGFQKYPPYVCIKA